MKKIFILLFAVLFFSCNSHEKTEGDPNYNGSLEKIQNGMTFEEVESVTGLSYNVEDLGKSETEAGDTSHLIQWLFGTNQSIMFTNGKVSGVELNIRATQERIQHIIDSAKASGGENGNAIIQPQR